MSNHLAIATVTSTLRQLLDDAVSRDVSGASVEILPLNDTKLRDSQAILNVFLYHVAPNAAFRNQELPARREDGTISRRPRLALDLYYMLTAYGKATQTDAEAHRLLGSAVRVLHEHPVLTRSDIIDVVQSHGSLAESDLADQIEHVRLTPRGLSLEEFSKIWSVFFQTPYRISISYEVSVVLIDGDARPAPSLPVQARNIYVVPVRTPVIERVTGAGANDEPILPGATIVIHGSNLRGTTTRVRIGALEIVPDPADLADKEIALTLPASLRAGVQGAQVVHPMRMGTSETEHSGVESNVAAFVLRPRIERNAADTAWEITVDVTDGAGSDPRSGDITIRMAPEIGRAQRVMLFLDALGAPAGVRPGGYAFEAPSRADDAAESTDTIVVPFAGVMAADYLVRVQVDGAESPLVPGAGGTLDEPTVTVS